MELSKANTGDSRAPRLRGLLTEWSVR